MAIVPEALTRRSFLLTAGAGALAASSALALPYYSRRHGSPVFSHGVQSGDVDCSSGMVWARTDRPAEVTLEYSTTDSFLNAARLPLQKALGASDNAVKAMLNGLLPDQDIFYRFTASDPYSSHLVSEPVVGRFRTAPMRKRSVRFVWSGDTAGQGWGIDDVGMKTYSTMLRHEPDFFIHSGDTVYADGPIPDEIPLRDGGVWKNRIVTDEKRTVARTLDEFRGQWKYNLLDEHLLSFNSQCPTFFQWDDHEVLNNWSESSDLTGDRRYPEKEIGIYEQRARRAFHEMTPIRYFATEPGRIFRKVAYGPLLDVFFVDLRSYRSPNQGGTQNGPPAAREREIADLLSFMRDNAIHNVVWLTADVHYTAAHHYDPSRAKFQEFNPFWEFVSGPLHSGTYGPKPLDSTFGPEVRFIKSSSGGVDSNLPPSAGLQFFGLVDINGSSEEMTVRLMDREDQELWRVVLPPVRSS